MTGPTTHGTSDDRMDCGDARIHKLKETKSIVLTKPL